MKIYTVKLARMEHHIYEITVEADNAEDAEEVALEEWENGGDLMFKKTGCVHIEEFIHEIKPIDEAA